MSPLDTRIVAAVVERLTAEQRAAVLALDEAGAWLEDADYDTVMRDLPWTQTIIILPNVSCDISEHSQWRGTRLTPLGLRVRAALVAQEGGK